MNGTIIEHDGKYLVDVGSVTRSSINSKRCPDCGGTPHGTAEITTAVAYGKITGKTLHFLGETESDDVWNNQTTLTLDDLPVLECSCCYSRYTTPLVTETA